MRAWLVFSVGLLVGGGLLALGQALLRPPADPGEPERRAVELDVDALSSSVLDRIVVRLDRIERRLDEGLLPPPGPDGAPRLQGTGEVPATAADGPAAEKVAIDPDALADALETIEERRWAGMSDEEVKQLAQRLTKDRDLAAARKALDRLLGRDLEPAERSEVLTQLGMVQRANKDFEGSAATLREAIRVVGLDSPTGVQAGMQLAWTLSKTEDYAGALRVAEDVMRVPSSEGPMRTNMRWGVGVLSALDGDVARARAEFETVVREAQSNPNLAGLAKDAARRLDQLR